MNSARSEHNEPCPSLVDVIRETSSQGARIDNVERFASDIHDSAEEIKKSVAKMDVKLALIVAGSFAGSAFGGRVVEAVRVSLIWFGERFSVYAGN